MNLRHVLAPAAALALVSCGGGESSGQEYDTADAMSGEAIAAELSEAQRPDPGQYRATVEVLEVDIPGAPAGAADMMRNMMGGQTHEYCLTQEDVEKGFEEMARQSQDSNCTTERFNVDGGKFDAVMSCRGEGGNMRMTLDGTGGATSSEMYMTMEGEIPGMGTSNIRMKTTHQRIGDCAG